MIIDVPDTARIEITPDYPLVSARVWRAGEGDQWHAYVITRHSNSPWDDGPQGPTLVTDDLAEALAFVARYAAPLSDERLAEQVARKAEAEKWLADREKRLARRRK